MHPFHLRNLIFGSAPRFPASVLLGLHYNNMHKTTTDSIHPSPKKRICMKSLLPLPTTHAFVSKAILGALPPFDRPDYGSITVSDFADLSILIPGLKQGIPYYVCISVWKKSAKHALSTS
jgi:hypothetical protein